MRRRTFLEFASYLYLKIAALVAFNCILAYGWWRYPLGHYGGTPLGYTLGTIGAVLILWLMWFGIQKRRYRATNNLKGWLSAHVYLGGVLIVVATLHTGFQVGWNVHTLAYVLMLVVIASGFFGVFAYLRFPRLMTENLAEDTLENLALKIADIDRECRQLALGMPDDVNNAVLQSIQATRIGGGVIAQLRERTPNCPASAAVHIVHAYAITGKGEAAQNQQRLYALVLSKERLVARARIDVRYKAMMEIWLYFHVPCSFALIAALTAHIVAVFFYH